MKIQKSSFISLLLLQVFLLTSATNAFAYAEQSLDLDSRKGEFFKATQNSNAILFEKSVSEACIQYFSENESEFFQTQLNPQFEYSLVETDSKNQLTLEFQLNNRSILKTQIFPFHFFW